MSEQEKYYKRLNQEAAAKKRAANRAAKLRDKEAKKREKANKEPYGGGYPDPY